MTSRRLYAWAHRQLTFLATLPRLWIRFAPSIQMSSSKSLTVFRASLLRKSRTAPSILSFAKVDWTKRLPLATPVEGRLLLAKRSAADARTSRPATLPRGLGDFDGRAICPRRRG